MPNQVIGTMEIRPIFYFYMNAPEIQLSSNLRIRAITKTEKFPRNDLSEPVWAGEWNTGMIPCSSSLIVLTLLERRHLMRSRGWERASCSQAAK